METLTSNGAKFADGREIEFDTVIFATGYRSNVPFWLKVTKLSLINLLVAIKHYLKLIQANVNEVQKFIFCFPIFI